MGTLGTLVFFLHLLGAAIWIGPQVMMFAVVVPSLRAVQEESFRIQVLRALAPRLGWLGGLALLLLVATGVYNVVHRTPADMFDYRYGYMLSLKIGLVVVIGVLMLAHSLWIGPRLLTLQEAARGQAGAQGEAELSSARVQSILVSSLTLLLSLFVLLIAAFLRSSFAYGRM